MTIRELTRTPAMRMAFFALVIAGATLVWQIVQAVRPAPLPDASPTMVASLAGTTRSVPRAPADIDAAVENDLFASDRSAPATAYRMPGENTDATPVAEPMKPQLLGTALGSDGRSFATLRLGDASPKLVVVGDKIGEWVVRGISRGKVVVVAATTGTRAELTVPKPGT
jgi:hypothetical protein